ncbi:MAG: choice-of-anchor Q domain-containing protein [Bacteroidota bacterium]
MQNFTKSSLLTFLFFCCISPIWAFQVTNTNDSGPGSLRGEIGQASNGDVITFAPALAGQTIVLQAPIQTAKNLTIEGPHNAADPMDASQRITLQGSGTHRLMKTSGVMNLRHLNFTQGFHEESGGALFNEGIMHVEFCDFVANRVVATATPEGFGGAVYTHGSNQWLDLTSCRFRDNYVAANKAYGGAAYVRTGNLRVRKTEFENNSARGNLSGFGTSSGYGGAMATGWWSRVDGPAYVTVEQSLFYNNYANSFIGHGYGGGIFVMRAQDIDNSKPDGRFIMENTTFSANRAESSTDSYESQGGGIYFTSSPPTSFITYSTFYGNKAKPKQGMDNGQGGAFYFNARNRDNNIYLTASVFESNYASVGEQFFANSPWPSVYDNPLHSLGFNVFQQAKTYTSLNGIFWSYWNGGSGDITAAVSLRPLANNGGPTRTHALGCNSSAKELFGLSSPTAVDQRGVARPTTVNPDAGAYQTVPLDTTLVHNLPDSRTRVCYNTCLNVEWEGIPGYTYRWTFVAPDGSYQVYTTNQFDYTTPASGKGVQIYVDIYDQSGCWHRVYLALALKTCGGGTTDCGPGGGMQRTLTEELTYENALQLAYPNPARDWVHFHPACEVHTVTVVDLQGRVRSLPWNAQQRGVNLAELPEGVYMIRLSDEVGQTLETHRVIKE